MKPYSHTKRLNPIEEEFRRRFWKGFWIAIAAGLGIAAILFAMGLIAFLGQKYGW